MTRSEILTDYKVESGVIRSPGKFEGEPIYAPHFWDALLNGCADGDTNGVAWFTITPEDRAEFPEIPSNRRVLRLREDGQGFVHVF